MSDVNGTVVALQGNPVSNAAPNDQEVLTWDATAGEWQPKAAPQPLEPWVGTPNTQRQLILKRIPFVVSVTRTGAGADWVSTGVSYNLPTGASLAVLLHHITVNTTNFQGSTQGSASGGVTNIGGTLTTPHDITNFAGTATGSLAPGGSYRFDVSGSVATVEIGIGNGAPGDVIDVQGYADLMVL